MYPSQEGRLPAGAAPEITRTDWGKNDDGSFRFDIFSNSYPEKTTWTMTPDGLLHLEASPLKKWMSNVEFYRHLL
jgi:hypothetical protein